MEVRPYGTWPSEIDFETISRIPASGFSSLDAGDGRVRWTESRSAERGRSVVVEWRGGEVRDVLPAGWNARTRAHEYGGGAVWYHGDTVFFSEFADGRVHRVDAPGAEPRPVTPEPDAPHALRYADGRVTPDGSLVVCVRERHDSGVVENELVAFPADGSAAPTLFASGCDFYAAPRVSPDGSQIAWLSWDHPRMPWNGTELWVADLAADGTVSQAHRLAGGPEESIFQPEWSPEGVLHFCTDRTGWWNLHRLEADGSERALTQLEDGEIGTQAWVFDMRRYAFLDDGRVACVVTRAAVDSLELLDPGTGVREPVGLGWTSYLAGALAAGDGKLAFAAASPTAASTVVLWDPASGEEQTIRRSLAVELDPAGISVPRAIEFPTGDGDVAHAFFYPPCSATYEGPEDERPPLGVFCHGGPTGHVSPSLSPMTQFFTSRGIGVVAVNYRGSSGYGREYWRKLDGRWGEIDWRDCAAAARWLAEQGEADAERTWVQGGSAGGYVVLCALTFEPRAFAAGVSLFGVADVEALELETHKFESHYSDGLIGPYPEQADLYRERSPIHFADRVEVPLLLLQGLEDKVVLPNQAEVMVAALERKGVPHAYIAFEGEGHGFRREENIRRTLEATLSFIGQVFGFEPADTFEPLEIARP